MRAIVFAGFLATILFAGCGESSTEDNKRPPAPPPPSKDTAKFFTLSVDNLRPLDTASGQYVLWIKGPGDSALRLAKRLDFWTRPGGLMTFSGSILVGKPDSLSEVLVSIEPMQTPASPSNQLIKGTYDRSQAAYILTTDSTVGDFSAISGSVLFTTASSDTNRARSEFYLMRLNASTPTASLNNLPVLPTGWHYGLWVLDSNFIPRHRFFYGLFSQAEGHDSDSSHDAFAFPGGYNPASLTDPAGRIEITLEPDIAIKNGKPVAPSPITLLYLRLQRFITLNQTIDLTNVWASSAPRGTLKFIRS
jgi:hypothetical protein